MTPTQDGLRVNKEMLDTIANTTESEIEQKKELFNYLTQDLDNWKMPFCAVIPEKDYEAFNDAAIWFTGATLQRRCYVDKTEDGPRLFVECEGYYNAIGV